VETLKSDLIKTIGHAGDVVLEIECTDGAVFHYSPVPFSGVQEIGNDETSRHVVAFRSQ
jgi:hypothetical protein